MSYFDPVLAEEQLRLLPEVMEVLKIFELEVQGQQFVVASYPQSVGKVKLINLGSLEKCDKENINIDSQKNYLEATR
jgi:hypothetical protein